MRIILSVLVLSLMACTQRGGEESDAGPHVAVTSENDAGERADASIPDAAFEAPDASAGDAGPLPDVEIPRALVWTDAELLDDPTAVGLSRVMSTICADESPGHVFEMWLRTFSTTAHSERAGPALLADELASTHGVDSSTWPLDELPFKVTGIHNRIDLARDGHCGEFRVTMASTHPVYRPLHFIWLFRMQGTDCAAVARRFAALSTLSADAFHDAARVILDEELRPENFLLAESVEFTTAPWEWRQWRFSVEDGACVAANPPLFQQVNRSELNMGGALHDQFIQFVEANVSALDERRIEIPERFRAPNVRVNQGVPWIPLDLGGLSSSAAAGHPNLRKNIEMVGCAACHTADAVFVQTGEDRMFSNFYRKELDARREHLLRIIDGASTLPPFGPLQTDPVLPP